MMKTRMKTIQWNTVLRLALCAALATITLSTVASAQTLVQVTLTGTVDYNQVNPMPLGAVVTGDPVSVTFDLDPAIFLDSTVAPTRGYEIAPATFSMTLGSVTVNLAVPAPAGETPYFVLRNDHPAADGFMLTSSLTSPGGVAINVNGIFGAFRANFSVSYVGSALSSLDILDAVGTHDFTGLTAFGFSIDDGPANPIGIDFTNLTIAAAIGDPVMRRGDCNSDSLDNIADAVFVLSVLFPLPGTSPPAMECEDACDGNDDGSIDIADAVAILGSLFGTPAVPLPPPTGACDFDPSADALPCDNGQSSC